MEYYLIIARSITYAQRMSRALEGRGIRAGILRTPAEVMEQGCGYALKIRDSDLAAALKAIKEAGLGPVRVFLYQRGRYRPVEGEGGL